MAKAEKKLWHFGYPLITSSLADTWLHKINSYHYYDNVMLLACRDGDVMLLPGTQSNGQHVVKRCTGGQWTHMCGNMDLADAKVICRQLGVSTHLQGMLQEERAPFR
jgi:hypothetical protein